MKLFFVRHGESDANILRQISNRGLVHPLTARGRTEAEKLAGSLAGVEITSIYSSPLLRAQQTAEVLAGSAGLDVTVTDSLREFDCGVLEGRSDAEAWHQHSALMSAWADPQQLAPEDRRRRESDRGLRPAHPLHRRTSRSVDACRGRVRPCGPRRYLPVRPAVRPRKRRRQLLPGTPDHHVRRYRGRG